MSAGSTLPRGTVSETYWEVRQTLCHTIAGIPSAVQVSCSFVPQDQTVQINLQLHHLHTLTGATQMPVSLSKQCYSWLVLW